MSLDAGALAQALWPHVGANDPQTGAPDPNPTEAIKSYAEGYVAMLKAAVVANAIPGTVLAAAAPPGAPIVSGAATGGKILVALGATMYGPASGGALPSALAGLLLECTAIASYLMVGALVAFSAGGITGNSTATPPPTTTPGPLVAGAGSGGLISGLDGSLLAKMVAAATLQTGPHQVEFYTALCTYTMSSALVTYPTNTVAGVCTGTGQFTLGLATGGAIT